MSSEEIISLVPYKDPFLFIDEIVWINDKGVEGVYTFQEDAFFYEGHFKDYPVTPGVLLTECMAQIGLVCLGIYLIKDLEKLKGLKVAFTNATTDYMKPVFPGEKVTVVSSMKYFRFNKLKCDVTLKNASGEIACKGTLSGMFST